MELPCKNGTCIMAQRDLCDACRNLPNEVLDQAVEFFLCQHDRLMAISHRHMEQGKLVLSVTDHIAAKQWLAAAEYLKEV